MIVRNSAASANATSSRKKEKGGCLEGTDPRARLLDGSPAKKYRSCREAHSRAGLSRHAHEHEND